MATRRPSIGRPRGSGVPLLAAAVLLAGVAATGADDPPDSPPPATAPAPEPEPAAPARVIVHPDRHTSVPATIEFEDETMLFVRLPGGKLDRFVKEEVRDIVRLVDPAPGQMGTILLRDGTSRFAVIVDDTFEHVTFEVEGVRARLRREIVDRVILQPSFEHRYEQFRGQLTPETPLRHLALCRWLADEGRYGLAVEELDRLMAIHDLPEARDLLVFVQARMALERGSRPGPRLPSGQPRPVRGDEAPVTLLTDADVNLVRVYEIDFDRPPAVVVPPATIARMLETYVASPLLPADEEQRKRLYSAAPLDVVRLLFALKARELYSGIDVLSEPYALNLFRQRVHDAWLMNNCATSRCHGDPDARLRLHRTRYKDARVRYTNFLTLERHAGDPEWPLINYDDPMASLIIQHGLPRSVARRPHPPAPGWKPVLRRPDDRMVRNTVEWIAAMMRPRMRYPVEYDPADPASAPDRESRPGRESR